MTTIDILIFQLIRQEDCRYLRIERDGIDESLYFTENDMA